MYLPFTEKIPLGLHILPIVPKGCYQLSSFSRVSCFMESFFEAVDDKLLSSDVRIWHTRRLR